MPSLVPDTVRTTGALSSVGLLGTSVQGGSMEVADNTEGEDALESLVARLNIEKRIRYGAEKFLEALLSPMSTIPSENRPALRAKVAEELDSSNGKIGELQSQINVLGETIKSRGKDYTSSNAPEPMDIPAHPISTFMTTRQTSHGDRYARALSHVTSSSTLASSFTSGSRLRSYSLSDQALKDQWESAGPQEESAGRSDASVAFGASPQSLQGGWEVPLVDQNHVLEARLKAESAVTKLARMGKTVATGKWSFPLVQRLLNTITSAVKLAPDLRKELDVDEILDTTLKFLVEPGESRVRAVGYRLWRHLLTRRGSYDRLRGKGLDWLLVKTFVRVPRSTVEIEQAILLIRAIMLLPTRPDPSIAGPGESPQTGRSRSDSRFPDEGPILSDPLVRVLVSCAENTDDPFHAVCLETLAELAVLDIRCLREADGYRSLLLAAGTSGSKASMGLCEAVLALYDSFSSRSTLPVPSGLEVLLLGLAQAYGKGAAHLEHLRVDSINLYRMLRSWSGLFALCEPDRQGVRSIVAGLKVPVTEMREAILDVIFAVLRIPVPEWFQIFLDIPNLRLPRQPSAAKGSLGNSIRTGRSRLDFPRFTYIEHYLSMILALFVEADLVEGIVELLQEEQPALNHKASFLLGEILRLSNHLLPIKYCLRVQAVPRLFELAAKFDTPEARISAISALASIESARTADRHSAQIELAAVPRNLAHGIASAAPRLRQTDQVKAGLGSQMDDRHFQSLLVESQLLVSKDHTKWNLEIMMEIIEGPLHQSRRLEEAFVASKFGRRLMHFFHPRNRRFSDIRATKSNARWIKLLLALVRTLLGTADGLKILQEDKLFKQVLECFSELDQYAGQPSGHPFFSKTRVESTLTQGYFDMIGLLSESSEGMRLLEQIGFFTCFYHLTELKSRDDLIHAIIERFDYTIDGHQRIVLSKALTSSYMHTRLYATQHLGRLIEGKALPGWGLELLVTQLYDPARQVCEAAAHYIDTACDDVEVLEALVKLRPTLDHLGDIGQSLHMRFLSTPFGFTYLREADYIDRQMEEWFADRNLLYVVQAESFLINVLDPISEHTEGQEDMDEAAPPHFYGEITRTEEGCRVLSESGHFAVFAALIRECGLETTDTDTIFKLKGALWAVGHIGSTLGGIAFLDEEEIVERIVEIAETSPVINVRATCFFALGLISTTMQGAEILDDHGWIATASNCGFTTGLCLPDDLSRFISLADMETITLKDPVGLPEPDDPTERRVLSCISALANEVIGTQALSRLQYFKAKQPSLFQSVDLFARVCHMLSSGHYRQIARAYAINMFDIAITRNNMENIERIIEILKRSVRDRTGSANGHSSTGHGRRLAGLQGEKASPGDQLHGAGVGGVVEPARKTVGFDGSQNE